jgi:ribosomal protein L13E
MISSDMDTQEIIAALRDEISRLSGALELLTRGTKRIGRPPKNPATAAPTAPAKHGRTFTAAERKAQGLRMKKMWAARRAAKNKAKA